MVRLLRNDTVNITCSISRLGSVAVETKIVPCLGEQHGAFLPVTFMTGPAALFQLSRIKMRGNGQGDRHGKNDHERNARSAQKPRKRPLPPAHRSTISEFHRAHPYPSSLFHLWAAHRTGKVACLAKRVEVVYVAHSQKHGCPGVGIGMCVVT